MERITLKITALWFIVVLKAFVVLSIKHQNNRMETWVCIRTLVKIEKNIQFLRLTGHALYHNVREGDWLMDYIVRRLDGDNFQALNTVLQAQ